MIAVVAVFAVREWELAAAFVNDHPVLSKVFDDGDRRGDHAPVLVAHSTAEFAGRHLEAPPDAAGELEGAVRELYRPPRD